MLLDGSRSRDTVVLVVLGAKGHNGLHRLKSWRAARDAVKHEPRSTASGSIGESLDLLALSLKVPIASRVGFVSLVASFPSAKCNLILTRAHSGVIYMARPAAWKSAKNHRGYSVCIRLHLA